MLRERFRLDVLPKEFLIKENEGHDLEKNNNGEKEESGFESMIIGPSCVIDNR